MDNEAKYSCFLIFRILRERKYEFRTLRLLAYRLLYLITAARPRPILTDFRTMSEIQTTIQRTVWESEGIMMKCQKDLKTFFTKEYLSRGYQAKREE